MESVANISLLFEQSSSLAIVEVFIHAFKESKKQPRTFYIFMNFTICHPNLHVKRLV